MCLHASVQTPQEVCGGQGSTSAVSPCFLPCAFSSCLLYPQSNWLMTFQELGLHLPSHLRSAGVRDMFHSTLTWLWEPKLSSSSLSGKDFAHEPSPWLPSPHSQLSFQHLPLELFESLFRPSAFIGTAAGDISLVHAETESLPSPGPEVPLLLFITPRG